MTYEFEFVSWLIGGLDSGNGARVTKDGVERRNWHKSETDDDFSLLLSEPHYITHTKTVSIII